MQNKIFIDTNIALDLLLDKRPFSNETKLLLQNFKKDTIFVINNLSLNTIFYVGTNINKQFNETFIFLKVIENSPKWEIYNLTKKDRLFCYDYMDKNINTDYEDLQQYICKK